ncbi:MAG: right-handed parallel beta-helix repeat-containing protein [Chitinispirillaceae bacterium]|nr:right-handed parallel beta-helix repeat-containing protein [Chitinispirillaceae bacterium]
MKSLKNGRLYLLPGSVAVFALLLFCIERNNPNDPCNWVEEAEKEKKEEVARCSTFYYEINNVINDTTRLSVDHNSLMREASNNFDSIKTINYSIQTKNNIVWDSIFVIDSINRQIEEGNRNIDCNFAIMKKSMSPKELSQMLAIVEIGSLLSEIESVEQRFHSLVADSANQKCPDTVFTEGYRGTIEAFFDLYKTELSAMDDSISSYKTRIDSSNRIIDSLNREIHGRDSLTDAYNDSLRLCRLPWIEDTAEIQQRIDSIVPGDTIALGVDSVHIVNFRFVEKGTPGLWTVIIGDPSNLSKKTTISASGEVFIESSSNIKFVNLIFDDIDNGVGARIGADADDITFSHCIFRNNYNKGIDAAECRNVTIDNCLFLHNGDSSTDTIEGAGIRIADCRDTIAIVNSLFAHNTGIGIDIHRSDVTIRNCTISDNSIDGTRYTGNTYNGYFVSYSSLFTFNGRYGIFRENEETTRDVFIAAEGGNRFFGNISGEMGGDPVITEDNKPFINVDPMFVDRANDNFRIGAGSPLFGMGIGYRY